MPNKPFMVWHNGSNLRIVVVDDVCAHGKGSPRPVLEFLSEDNLNVKKWVEFSPDGPFDEMMHVALISEIVGKVDVAPKWVKDFFKELKEMFSDERAFCNNLDCDEDDAS